MSSNNIVVLFTAKYELPDWKKALSKYNYKVLHFEGILSDIAVKHRKNQIDLFINGPLEGCLNPLGGIWRTGAIKPQWEFEPFLELLDSVESSFPMVNTAKVHLICANRVRMLSALNSKGSLPIVPYQAFVTGRAIIESRFEPSFPLVVKIGNYQQGLMKWKIENENQWHDIFGAFRALEQSVIIEDFIDFDIDYRAIFIGEEIHLIKREFEGWKANRARSLEIVGNIPSEIQEMVMKAKQALNIDVGAVDFVEGKEGYTIFEIGDTPDLDPDFIQIEDPWDKVASILHKKIKN